MQRPPRQEGGPRIRVIFYFTCNNGRRGGSEKCRLIFGMLKIKHLFDSKILICDEYDSFSGDYLPCMGLPATGVY